VSFDLLTLRAAHKHSAAHRQEVQSSAAAGCFSCVSTYPPAFISDWTEETGGSLAMKPDRWTALCPECGIDAVIGGASGFPVHDLAFSKAMNNEWFGGDNA
jgi:hypothetical protein